MPYLSKSGLLKIQGSKTYVFTSHDWKVQDSPNCPEVLKYGIYVCAFLFLIGIITFLFLIGIIMTLRVHIYYFAI
jgi:hypothetical protein